MHSLFVFVVAVGLTSVVNATYGPYRKVLLRNVYQPMNFSRVFESYSTTAGPNLCAVEYVPELGRALYTDAGHWLRRSVCGYRTQIRYECCEGYTSLYGTSDCSALIGLEDILHTASRLGANLFVDYIQRTPSVLDLLLREANGGTVTLFAPSDEAFRLLSAEKLRIFESDLHRNILYHVLQGRHYISELPNGESSLQSFDGFFSPLRVSRFSNQMATINCHLVTRRDRRATNGVVHLIDSVLDPPSSHDSMLLNVLSSDNQFSELYRLVSSVPEIHELLRDTHRTFTVIAPTNDAFRSLEAAEYSRIFSDRVLARELLNLHIVEQSMCSPAVVESLKVRTLSGAQVAISCDRSGLTVNGKQSRLLREYHFATNGFLTAVDRVLVPESVRTVWNLITQREDLKLFADCVRHYGLENYLQDSTVTVFAPSDNAIRQWARSIGILHDEELFEALSRQFIYNHIVYGSKIATSMFIDGKSLTSMENFSNLRLRVARRWYGVDLAKIVDQDICGSNGVLHVIDRALSQRKLHFADWINESDVDGYGYFKQFRTLVRRSRSVMKELKYLDSKNSTITIFAPSDEAFKSFDVEKMLNTPKKLEYFVRGHIVHDEIPLETMSPNSTYLLSTESRSPLRVISGQNSFTVNGAKVLKADELFADGVLHNIDKILVKGKAFKG